MFMGEFNHSIDAKGRLILPSRFREELGEKCVLSKGYEGCLDVYTEEQWQKFVDSLASLSPHNPDARRVLRTFSSGAVTCEPDKQGRVIVPQVLREFAGMDGEKKDVVVVGSFTKIEVWSAERWKGYNEGDDALTLEQAGARLAEMGL